jgi:CRP/FNR family transcriptional regulator, cyclic AMP receptor protein
MILLNPKRSRQKSSQINPQLTFIGDSLKAVGLGRIFMMLSAAETVKILQKQGNSRVYPANSIIFRAGEPGDEMFGILAGEVLLEINDLAVETFHAGDIFGEGALVDPNGLRATTAIAKTDCTLAVLDRQRFIFAVQETPMFAINVMRSYAERLRALKARL